MNFLQLPKIDLHCHLDGSVRPQTVIDLAKIQGTAIPSDNVDEIKALMVAPESCPNLDEYLTRFALPVSVMQTEAALERISFELFEDAAKENVKYLEVRFGPQLHRKQGLNFEQIIGSVVKGMRRAEAQYNIKGNYILSIIKVLPKDDINDVIDAGAKFLDNGVVAFDLAASEEPGFCHEYIPYAKYALEKGYRITIHAGEQGVGQNVYDAIALLGAERIGHGIHINSHKQAYDLVRAEAVALETCPSSNVQTKAVENLESHPFGDFYRDGLLVTINTDNRTVSDTTMTKELQLAVEKFNLTEQDYMAIYKISANNSFASDAVKQHLLQFVA